MNLKEAANDPSSECESIIMHHFIRSLRKTYENVFFELNDHGNFKNNLRDIFFYFVF